MLKSDKTMRVRDVMIEGKTTFLWIPTMNSKTERKELSHYDQRKKYISPCTTINATANAGITDFFLLSIPINWNYNPMIIII